MSGTETTTVTETETTAVEGTATEVAAITETAQAAADAARTDEKRWGDHAVEHVGLDRRMSDLEMRPMVSREEFDGLASQVGELRGATALAAEAAATAVEIVGEVVEDATEEEVPAAEEATPPAQEPPRRKRGYA